MTFDAGLFVFEMCRRSLGDQLARAEEELWPIYYDTIRLVTIPNIAVYDIDAIDVKVIYIDGISVNRTREVLLDAMNPDWRNAYPGLPTSFIWNGENNSLRLFPAPDVQRELWGIVQRNPSSAGDFPPWFQLYNTIRAAEIISLNNPVVGRVRMVEYLNKLKGAFGG